MNHEARHTASIVLCVLAIICGLTAFAITATWVTAHGTARDLWFIAGTVLFAASFLVED